MSRVAAGDDVLRYADTQVVWATLRWSEARRTLDPQYGAARPMRQSAQSNCRASAAASATNSACGISADSTDARMFSPSRVAAAQSLRDAVSW
jgi:hypothetical protein